MKQEHTHVRIGRTIREVDTEGRATGGTVYDSINAAKRESRALRGSLSVSPVRTAESLERAA